MHHRKSQPLAPPFTLFQRAGIIAIGATIFSLGLATLLKGKLQYSNYWGGAVFAPYALLIGPLVVLVGIVARRK